MLKLAYPPYILSVPIQLFTTGIAIRLETAQPVCFGTLLSLALLKIYAQ